MKYDYLTRGRITKTNFQTDVELIFYGRTHNIQVKYVKLSFEDFALDRNLSVSIYHPLSYEHLKLIETLPVNGEEILINTNAFGELYVPPTNYFRILLASVAVDESFTYTISAQVPLYALPTINISGDHTLTNTYEYIRGVSDE